MAGVDLVWQPPDDKKSLRCRGESIRFRQMMANLICNGFDAYNPERKDGEKREVVVSAAGNESDVVITINDWGRGVPEKERPKLFEPFHSTKETGMGMGLFVVRQIAEEHFLGEASIDTSKDHTVFVIKLPKAVL